MSSAPGNLAVSNIAWESEEEVAVAALLQELAVHRVEIAPTKVFRDPLSAEDSEVEGYRRFWSDRGIDVVAFQSLLFGRPDLQLFGAEEVRKETAQHLAGFLRLAGRLRASRLVFGSPKNRVAPKGMTAEEADGIAIDFFRELAEIALENGTRLCIEPNPVQYGCNWVVNASEGISLVERVGHPGFGLHLDSAGMAMAGDDISASIFGGRDVLSHFHVSAPQLGPIETSVVDHSSAAAALSGIRYAGTISIEMRSGGPGTNLDRVRSAVETTRSSYGLADA